MLPLIATRRLGLGAGGYGVLLGALGAGAVGGAFVLPQVRARLSANALVVVASLIYAAALVVVVLSRNLALTEGAGPPWFRLSMGATARPAPPAGVALTSAVLSTFPEGITPRRRPKVTLRASAVFEPESLPGRLGVA